MPLNESLPRFDRTFDDLYAELRARIPMYNREWTNFNDSDPGITLLQLFAFLGETLLHQMNQVPRRNYLKFAQLLGLELRAPKQATVRLTFTPKANERPATIPERSVYSAPVEGGPPLQFETVRALDVIGAPLAVTAVRADGRVELVTNVTSPKPEPFFPLGRNPQVGNALYLGFKENAANPAPFPRRMTFLALRPQSDTAGVAVKAGDHDRDLVPPVSLVWEYRPREDRDVWERLNVLKDETVAFTHDGYVEVAGPERIEASRALGDLVKQPMYWLRVRLDQRSYPAGRAPRLDYLLPNTVDAENLTTVRNVTLDASSGHAGQVLFLPQRSIDARSLELIIQHNGKDELWEQRPDLSESMSDSKHYVLNAASGSITFGDGLNGLIPTAGDAIIARSFRHGGGARGNRVAAAGVTGMVSQVAGIDKVMNVRPPTGGADEQSIEDFERNAPSVLRRRGRAVTAEDFEKEAIAIDGVKQARAIAGRHPDYPGVTVPGAVTVMIIPDSTDRPPKPSAELLTSVGRAIDRVRLITTEVYVASAAFIEIRVEALVVADPKAAFDQIAVDARKALDDVFDARKWEFGRDVSIAEIYRVLFIGQVRSVENLLVYVDGRLHDVGGPVRVPSDAVIYSGDHIIVVQPEKDEDAGGRA
jgi:predicted phage baseplate assembly protein